MGQPRGWWGLKLLNSGCSLVLFMDIAMVDPAIIHVIQEAVAEATAQTAFDMALWRIVQLLVPTLLGANLVYLIKINNNTVDNKVSQAETAQELKDHIKNKGMHNDA